MVYYELLKPSKTITGDQYQTQLMRLRRALKEKRTQYQERLDFILQHDKTRAHGARPVKTYLEPLKREVLLHPPYCPDVAPSTTICFDRSHKAWLISISALMKKLKNGSIRESPQKTHCFCEMLSDNCQKDGKK